MRILVLENDEFLARSLTTVLTRRGHDVRTQNDPNDAPDAVILGLPAPYRVSPRSLPPVPLLLLAGELPYGELERWIDGRSRWGVMSKPASEPCIARWLLRQVPASRGAHDRAGSAALLSPAPQ